MNAIKTNLSMPDYLASEGISKHDLDLFADCPAKYRAKALGLIRNETTDAMRFGAAVHAAVFENRRDYVVRPDTYADGKKWTRASTFCREWEEAHEGNTILSADDDRRIDAIVRAVKLDKRAAQLIGAGQFEVSLFAEDEPTGLQLKGRPDFITIDNRAIVDLKTTRAPATGRFADEIAARRYHVQASMYLRLCRLVGLDDVTAFYFIAVDTSGVVPFLNVRKLGNASISYADQILSEELERLSDAMATNTWHDYSGPGDAIEVIDLPDYAFKLAAIDLES